MVKQQLQPDELVFTGMHGAPIISLDNNTDWITGVDDAMVEETVEQQDTPTQIIEQEEMIDSSRPSDHATPSSITQLQQTTLASTKIDNTTIIKEERITIDETAGVPINKEESTDNSEDAAVTIHETAGVSFQEDKEENINSDEDEA
eukprot:3613216-Ditylum_brightwellii.AAC.1